MAFPQCPPQHSQPCDTFFVQGPDQQFPTSRICSKEQAKLVARERQYAMADAMSKAVCDDYQSDILAHMHAMDSSTLADVDSIDIQTEIQWFMRPYLLDFLVEAHSAFQLLPATLFLTINLLDRYCSKRVVYKRHYQLVGCAALLIAAKYGDKKDRVPTIKELKSMCCSLYDEDMFVQMEWHVLQTLSWSVGHPTVDSFLQIAVVDLPYDPELEHLTLYILEIALFYRDFVSRLSSDLARAALALSRCILNRPQPRQTDWASHYDPLTLVTLSQNLREPSQVLSRKYSSSHYSRVSRILEQFLARQPVIDEPPNPPTPPADRVTDHNKTYAGQVGLSTPQKQPYANSLSHHGYITPPITPENDAFGTGGTSDPRRGPEAIPPHVRSSSPKPMALVPYGQSQQQQCHHLSRQPSLFSQQQQQHHHPHHRYSQPAAHVFQVVP